MSVCVCDGIVILLLSVTDMLVDKHLGTDLWLSECVNNQIIPSEYSIVTDRQTVRHSIT